MRRMARLLRGIRADERGQDLAEYGIALAVVSIGVALIVLSIGSAVSGLWQQGQQDIDQVVTGS